MRAASSAALLALLWSAAEAYRPASPQSTALHEDGDPNRVGIDVLNYQFRRTGSPVPSGWRPHMESLPIRRQSMPSVGQLTEQRAAPEAIITYVHPNFVSSFAARFSKHQPGRRPEAPDPPITVSYHRTDVSDDAGDEELMAVATAMEKVQGNAANKTNATKQQKKPKKKKDNIDPSKRTGISRCGWTWDDAAAKAGPTCNEWATCHAPDNTVKNKNSYWYQHNYSCYADVPKLAEPEDLRVCRAVSLAATDAWCTDNCNGQGVYCDPHMCDCSTAGDELDEFDMTFKIPESFNVSAPIQPHDLNVSASKLPVQSFPLVAKVKKQEKDEPSGLPACTWRPPAGCKKEAPYQCIEGESRGLCSEKNWFDYPDKCSSSCIHDHLLPVAPYSPLWYPGPLCREFRRNETQPRYKHTPEKISLRARGIDLRKSDIMMSGICRSTDNQFVGISMYSPKFKAKAERLLRSCSRIGICCKATLLPADAFGPDAPEGSEAFRFETISSKPSFILDEIEATHHPVVFLDTDLEFHRFPHLFVPGSWPNGPRDFAIFNYWGNETKWKYASTPTTGSGVVFFNKTDRAKNLLKAWAEAMAWKGNTRAPDDQVLDRLLKQGKWLARASAGWLPAAYMRTVPAYYRGIVPVIDHDHGNMPGLLNHSEAKPVLPPVRTTAPSHSPIRPRSRCPLVSPLRALRRTRTFAGLALGALPRARGSSDPSISGRG